MSIGHNQQFHEHHCRCVELFIQPGSQSIMFNNQKITLIEKDAKHQNLRSIIIFTVHYIY